MTVEAMSQNRKNRDTVSYHRTRMQKELVLRQLKDRGCRITKQRQMLLDIILEEDCACCKEIYYKALEQEPGIGAATVYRMVNLLEEIGAISRKNMYKISCSMACGRENACTIELDDKTVYHLNARDWYEVIQQGLKSCGYLQKQKISSVLVEPCDFCE